MRPRKRSDFVSLHECGSIQKADSVSLGIFTLRIMLPTNHWTHLHLSFANQSSLKWRELRIESPLEWHIVPRLHFPRKRSVRLAYLFDSSGLTGLEPAASALTGRCSDQLNYNPRDLRDLAENVILFYPPPIRYLWRIRGFYHLMVDWWIVGSSWIWTSVDILLPTNLQSVPINRSGIDPGRIHFGCIGNSWPPSFRSTLPPGEVESPLPPWKRDVLNH